MSVFITARISTSEQEESGLGMESQIAECTRYAQEHGLGTPTAVFTDCITRKSDVYSRPGLSALLSQVRKGDTVLAYRFDRLGDSLAVSLLMRDLQRKGVRLIAVNGGDTETIEGKLVAELMGVISNHELRVISARTKAALKVKKDRGEKFCRKVFGYVSTPEGKLVESPQEQEIIRRILDLRAQGWTLREIAAELEQAGITGPEGKGWHSCSVGRIAKRAAQTQAA